MITVFEIHDKNGLLYTGEYFEVMKAWAAISLNEKYYQETYNEENDKFALKAVPENRPYQLISKTIIDNIG